MRLDADDFMAESETVIVPLIQAGFPGSSRRYRMWQRIFLIPAHEIVLDDPLLRVDIDINDSSLANTLNVVSFPV